MLILFQKDTQFRCTWPYNLETPKLILFRTFHYEMPTLKVEIQRQIPYIKYGQYIHLTKWLTAVDIVNQMFIK